MEKSATSASVSASQAMGTPLGKRSSRGCGQGEEQRRHRSRSKRQASELEVQSREAIRGSQSRPDQSDAREHADGTRHAHQVALAS